MKTTSVIKVTTGEILVFKNLSPREAVRNAFVREALHGMELADSNLAIALVKRDGNAVYLGDYVSFNEQPN
jgi:hypothetical protein